MKQIWALISNNVLNCLSSDGVIYSYDLEIVTENKLYNGGNKY